MNALTIFIVIFVIESYFVPLRSQDILTADNSTASTCPPVPAPVCYSNRIKQCRTFDTPCEAALSNCQNKQKKLNWQITDAADCLFREPNEVKVCFSLCSSLPDCALEHKKDVCGVNVVTNICKKFSNSCYLQKDTCLSANLTAAWRYGKMDRCQDLKPDGVEGPCKDKNPKAAVVNLNV
ncbi:uncharacterized protein ACRADG_006679 [Cochliomyia hominivorax]